LSGLKIGGTLGLYFVSDSSGDVLVTVLGDVYAPSLLSPWIARVSNSGIVLWNSTATTAIGFSITSIIQTNADSTWPEQLVILLLATTQQTSVVAFDLASGTLSWRITKLAPQNEPTLLQSTDSHVVIVPGNPTIVAIDYRTGQTTWSVSLGSSYHSDTLVYGSVVQVENAINGNSNAMVMLDASSGQELWRFPSETAPPTYVWAFECSFASVTWLPATFRADLTNVKQKMNELKSNANTAVDVCFAAYGNSFATVALNASDGTQVYAPALPVVTGASPSIYRLDPSQPNEILFFSSGAALNNMDIASGALSWKTPCQGGFDGDWRWQHFAGLGCLHSQPWQLSRGRCLRPFKRPAAMGSVPGACGQRCVSIIIIKRCIVE